MAFDPDAAGTSFRITEVRGAAWEEIDEGKAGADLGWNLYEGYHDNPYQGGQINCLAAPFTLPSTSTVTIAGVPRSPVAPTRRTVCGPASTTKTTSSVTTHTVGSSGSLPRKEGGYTPSGFAPVEGGDPIAMTFRPTYGGNQALYYATYAGGGQVRRIEHTDTPTAVVTADSTSEEKPLLTYEFDGSESRDPKGDALTYLWDFGDGNTDETTYPKTSYAYSGSRRIHHHLAGAGQHRRHLHPCDGARRHQQLRLRAGGNSPDHERNLPRRGGDHALRQGDRHRG